MYDREVSILHLRLLEVHAVLQPKSCRKKYYKEGVYFQRSGKEQKRTKKSRTERKRAEQSEKERKRAKKSEKRAKPSQKEPKRAKRSEMTPGMYITNSHDEL